MPYFTELKKLILIRRPWLFLLPLAHAQFASPPPVRDLAATDITGSSITLTFSEDNYFKTEIICQPDGTLINPGSSGNRTFTGLEPGKLYSFLATTVDPNSPDRRSEPVSLNQDTVPPKPSNLELSTFEVLTVEVTFFGSKVPHRIDTSGILAEWSEPAAGHCDCYQAAIGPDEGLQIEPKDEGGEVKILRVN